VQLFFELFVEAGVRVGRAPFQARKRTHPVLAGLGLLALGAAVGLIVSWIFPRPFFRFNVLPGASLILSPILNGAVMEYYGRWSERRTGSRTHLATFWGGALFAFGMALVRFLMTQER
jgi:MFS family permease